MARTGGPVGSHWRHGTFCPTPGSGLDREPPAPALRLIGAVFEQGPLMTMLADAIPESPAQAQYARFSRRLRAMFVDWVLALVVIFGAILIAASVGNEIVSRVLAIFAVLFFVLYEPLLVSRRGGTIGHWYTNLRVVDDRTGGNLPLRKAFIRAGIKAVLGAYSFVVMLATRRNQALHDLLTHSTVQIRNAAKARSGDYITERTELASPGLPSHVRRIAVIVAYLALALLVYVFAFAVFYGIGAMSDACLDNDVCSASEKMLELASGIAFLFIAAAVIGLGWRGRLFGARRTA
jgi:uncharacterized RDD family membrane protein YckC